MFEIEDLKDGVYMFISDNNAYIIWSDTEAFKMALCLFAEGKLTLNEFNKVNI